MMSQRPFPKLVPVLRYFGNFGELDTKEFIEFIKNNDTLDIEWSEPYKGVRSDKLYKRPMSHAVIVGEYSRWIPKSH